MAKIIHLSDLHVGSGDCRARFTTLVHNLLATPDHQDYVVVITGDLVNVANAHDYDIVRGLLAHLDDAGYRVLVVPGNHDVGFGFIAKPDWVARFSRVFYGDPEASYPRVDVVDDTCFIGLFSTAEELGLFDRFGAQGELGEHQLQALEAVLARETAAHRVVYLHHHPRNQQRISLRLKDSEQLRAVLETAGHVDALLFGHHHDFVAEGPWAGVPHLYNAGSSTGKHCATAYHRIIDLNEPYPVVLHNFLQAPYRAAVAA